MGDMPAAPRPPLSDTPAPGDRKRWLELLDQLDPHALTDTFLTHIVTVPGYDPPPVPLSEVRRTGRLSFIALVDGLRAGGLTEAIPVARDVGVSRARARIPITSLMTAIRADFAVLWEALTRIADPADAELIVRHTGIVLRTVDEYAGQTQQAYVAEQQRMREEEDSVRRGLIAAVFQDPPPAAERLAAISGDLGLPPHTELTVTAAVGDDIPALRFAVSELDRAGGITYTHHLDDTLIAFTRQIDLPGSHIDERYRELLDLRIGLASARDGLADLRGAAHVARDLAHVLAAEETGAMTWSRGWARLAAHSLLSSGNPVIADVHAALAQCGDAERTRLEEAVRSYLRTGNIGVSAEELFCHRNTLTNRLHRFTDLTGVNPMIPHEAARLVVGWA
ncbi:PucR-like helix-turn-helix protein [Leucobacter luti]|uniref:PucR-like helix-turn-helix protein n=2 Tax=Leucobacter luti TaxID=340320 RepID=A0A4R6S1R1_9MICO|nr:PucR-like helix-turn-helix protein [Leucobacter luti]TDP93460.1 PucR-like helix-turn-helix protein [Leucobacter luti]